MNRKDRKRFDREYLRPFVDSLRYGYGMGTDLPDEWVEECREEYWEVYRDEYLEAYREEYRENNPVGSPDDWFTDEDVRDLMYEFGWSMRKAMDHLERRYEDGSLPERDDDLDIDDIDIDDINFDDIDIDDTGYFLEWLDGRIINLVHLGSAMKETDRLDLAEMIGSYAYHLPRGKRIMRDAVTEMESVTDMVFGGHGGSWRIGDEIKRLDRRMRKFRHISETVIHETVSVITWLMYYRFVSG